MIFFIEKLLIQLDSTNKIVSLVISNNLLIDKHENSTLEPEYDLPSALVKYLSQHCFEFVNRLQARC